MPPLISVVLLFTSLLISRKTIAVRKQAAVGFKNFVKNRNKVLKKCCNLCISCIIINLYYTISLNPVIKMAKLLRDLKENKRARSAIVLAGLVVMFFICGGIIASQYSDISRLKSRRSLTRLSFRRRMPKMQSLSKFLIRTTEMNISSKKPAKKAMLSPMKSCFTMWLAVNNLNIVC